jgi:hypothetical protein
MRWELLFLPDAQSKRGTGLALTELVHVALVQNKADQRPPLAQHLLDVDVVKVDQVDVVKELKLFVCTRTQFPPPTLQFRMVKQSSAPSFGGGE